jgi:IS30 family transposase
MLAGLPGAHTADVVADALADAITRLPGRLRRSLTWDQGKEMAEHARFSVAAGVPVYFCDPHSPWQRGSNENTNGLLRQYFPRSTDFRALTQRDLDNVAAELNDRPGKRSDGSHHVRHWTRRCDDPLRPPAFLRGEAL